MLGTAPRGAGDVSCVSTYIPSGSPIQERVGGRHLWNAHLHSRVTSFPDLRCRGTEPSLLAPGNQCVFSKQSAFGLRWSQLLVPPTGWRKSSIRLGPGVAQRMSHKASVINRDVGRPIASATSICEANQAQMHATRMQTPFEIRNHFKTPGFSAVH